MTQLRNTYLATCNQLENLEELLDKIIFKLKMRPLQSTERVLIWLCLLPADKPLNPWAKLSHICLAAVVVTMTSMYLAASIAYFIRVVSTDLDESIYASFQITGILPTNVTFMVLFCMRYKIERIFNKFSEIYAESEKI